MNRLPLISTSKRLNISPTQCRYWSKLLSLEITKEGKTAFLPAGSDKLLLEVKHNINSGMAPSLAVKNVLDIFATSEPSKEIDIPDNNNLADLQKAVMILAESNKKILDDNQLLKAQNTLILETVSKQAKQLNKLSLMIEIPKVRKKVEVWKAPVAKKKHVPFFKRLFLELFNPMSLRIAPKE